MAKRKKDDKFYLGNPNLPTATTEFEWTSEMIDHLDKCKGDIIYFADNFFYIIDPDVGRVKIDLFDYQRRCLDTIKNNRKTILLASRQVGKSTILTMYALWEACFFADKSIVLIANKEATAIEIFRRIKLAYEQLPNYLKPGIDEWAKTSVKFSNGSRILISTTTGSAARGMTINTLLLDELAFIEPQSILEDFWRSVMPTISRAKTSKVLISSTPNGTNNLFHDQVTGAKKEGRLWNGFKLETIKWDEIPGRDEDWKNERIAELGSYDSFLQEYECHFIDSGDAAIDEKLFAEMLLNCTDPIMTTEEGCYKIWDEPDAEHTYIAGIDTSEGVDKDASVIQILDITDIRNIQQVACYHNKKISPAKFADKCFEILCHWGRPLALIERNNQGAQVVDRLIQDMNYENIVNYGAKEAKRVNMSMAGIVSHTNTKYKAVMNQRYYLNEARAVTIRDKETLEEFRNFIRYPNGTWKAKSNEHDDRVMSLIWALLMLEKSVCERYFEIVEFDLFGKPVVIDRQDFGIKYFMNPTSIYSQKETENYSTLMVPVVFGMGDAVMSDMDDLMLDGWTVYGLL